MRPKQRRSRVRSFSGVQLNFWGSVSGMLCWEWGSGRAGRTVGEPLASAPVFFLGGMVIVCWV